MIRFVSLLLVVLASLAQPARATSDTHAVPDHHHWTANQFVRYWAWLDPNVTTLVTSPSNAEPHEPLDSELDHTQFLVKQNVTKTLDPAHSEVVVELYETPPGLKMARIPVAGTWSLEVWRTKKIGGVNYSLADVVTVERTLVVPQYTSTVYNATDYLTNDTKWNHPAWPTRDPIYEGGTVGVIINGHELGGWAYVLVALATFGATLLGRSILTRKRT